MAEMVIRMVVKVAALLALALSLCQCSGWKNVDSVRFIEVVKDRFSIELDDSAIIHVGATRFGEGNFVAKVRLDDDLAELFLSFDDPQDPLVYFTERVPFELDWWGYEGVATHVTISVPAIRRQPVTTLEGDVIERNNQMTITMFPKQGFAFIELILEESF